MKQGVATALILAGVAYPFFVYFGLERLGAAWLVLPLALLWLMRAVLAPNDHVGGRLLPAIAVAFCAAVAISGSSAWLLAYPVLINAMLFVVFVDSLRRGMPLVERLARIKTPDLPPQGVRYTRRVTQIWACFFIANGSIAAILAIWAPWSWWTAYNGCISYILMGLLMAGEWLVRPALPNAARPQ